MKTHPMTQRQAPDLHALAEALVTVDSVNPDLVPGGAGEGELAELVGGWLAERGVHVTYQEAAPGRLNVVGRVAGRGGGRSLMLNAHLDTVGTASMPEALRPLVSEGRMYGRGAHDTKASLAAAISSAHAMSAVASVRTSGVLETSTPRRLQAATSMLSNPTA